jgi:hypothetical protein
MSRITRKQLDSATEGLNRVAGAPLEPYTCSEEGRAIANLNNYHISGAYGGYALHQMMNTSGGVRDVFNSGHIPARELLSLIWAFRNGFETAKEGA